MPMQPITARLLISYLRGHLRPHRIPTPLPVLLPKGPVPAPAKARPVLRARTRLLVRLGQGLRVVVRHLPGPGVRVCAGEVVGPPRRRGPVVGFFLLDGRQPRPYPGHVYGIVRLRRRQDGRRVVVPCAVVVLAPARRFRVLLLLVVGASVETALVFLPRRQGRKRGSVGADRAVGGVSRSSPS